ncbi:bifunctional protein-disulfide isomerase/oxidoreductase DsbC [Parasalinivibrio latis]|uniref:bifunctional protein-disulfide isomerase/oxidoreductase DsbC n=1 Tax=Parasalinivibrio latis TaxID=2952610 RepID=UPI0030E5909D
MLQLKRLSALLLMVTAFTAHAAEDNQAIKQTFSPLGLTVSEIAKSPVDGLLEVTTDRGIFYATPDGKHFMAGYLYEATGGEPRNLTEEKNQTLNVDRIKAVEDEMIVYPAKDEKYVVTVFTDTTCGYCMKLHKNMKGYNDLGITVRYLAFPRYGLQAPNFEQMSAIWCAADPAKAMDDAKTGSFKEENRKCADIVAKHFNLGQQMGVRGTPAIVLQDGTMLPGYQDPEDLLRTLQAHQG